MLISRLDSIWDAWSHFPTDNMNRELNAKKENLRFAVVDILIDIISSSCAVFRV
jgi:hypothetical protein